MTQYNKHSKHTRHKTRRCPGESWSLVHGGPRWVSAVSGTHALLLWLASEVKGERAPRPEGLGNRLDARDEVQPQTTARVQWTVEKRPITFKRNNINAGKKTACIHRECIDRNYSSVLFNISKTSHCKRHSLYHQTGVFKFKKQFSRL